MARSYPVQMLPAVITSAIVFALMVVVTLSTPVWDNVYFLKLDIRTSSPFAITFGVLGSTGKGQQVGYVPAEWPLNGNLDPRIQDERLSNITFALLLHPIAAIFSIFTTALSTIALRTRRAAVAAVVTATFAALSTLIGFVVDMVLFTILRVRLLDEIPGDDTNGLRETSYGPAIWIMVVAVIISWIPVASAGYTAFRRAVYPRKWESETKA